MLDGWMDGQNECYKVVYELFHCSLYLLIQNWQLMT